MPFWFYTLELDSTYLLAYLLPLAFPVPSVSCNSTAHLTPFISGVYTIPSLASITFFLSLVVGKHYFLLSPCQLPPPTSFYFLMSSNMRVFHILMIIFRGQLDSMSFNLLSQQGGITSSNINGHNSLHKQPNDENWRGKNSKSLKNTLGILFSFTHCF